MTSHTIFLWIGFNLFVIALLAVDLGVFHRESREIKIREALVWSLIWTVVALLFNGFIWWQMGPQKGLEFLSGYVVERSLSMDNLFVFLLIFTYFKVSLEHQYKVLFWGILAALVMRALFIVAGVALISRFHWLLYLFGAFLVYTGIKMAVDKGQEMDLGKNRTLKFFRRFIPLTDQYEGSRFMVKRNGKRMATPLLLVLMVVNTADLVFAFDSIPAVLAITLDPFIVYTSNVFAILGLRALYFALAGMMQLFRYLNYGLAIILAFVGAKMLLVNWFPIPTAAALGVVCGVLALSILISILFPEHKKEQS